MEKVLGTAHLWSGKPGSLIHGEKIGTRIIFQKSFTESRSQKGLLSINTIIPWMRYGLFLYPLAVCLGPLFKIKELRPRQHSRRYQNRKKRLNRRRRLPCLPIQMKPAVPQYAERTDILRQHHSKPARRHPKISCVSRINRVAT